MIRISTALLLLLFFSCGSKLMKNTTTFPEGTYKGQFIRSSPLARYAPANITLTFKGNKFSGTSDRSNYPAICEGTFEVKDKYIEFKNDCSFTADFDWSYILKGSFEFTWQEGTLEMTRKTGDTTDHYSVVLVPATN